MIFKDKYLTPNWPAPAHIKSFSTMRQGGFSNSPYNALNLGQHVNDIPETVEKNRHLIQTDLSIPTSPLWLNQTHSAIVIDAREHVNNIEADAIISRQAYQCLVIMTADCLPILLCTEKGTKIAAIHAGWKSLCSGIIQNTINKLQLKNEKLYAWLGPCISQKYFEVGSEVKAAFSKIDFNYEKGFIFNENSQKFHACLKTLAKNQLRAIDNIAVYQSDECTYQNLKNFYSYRREGITGRMATLIWMDTVI